MNLKLVEVQTLVSDINRAQQFYQEVLGFKLKQKGDSWLIFDLQGMEFVVMAGASPRPKKNGADKFCCTMLVLHTDQIEHTIDLLKEKGVSFQGKMATVPQGKFVEFSDPDGNVIELVQQNRVD